MLCLFFKLSYQKGAPSFSLSNLIKDMWSKFLFKTFLSKYIQTGDDTKKVDKISRKIGTFITASPCLFKIICFRFH